jgi:hypothetical protein
LVALGALALFGMARGLAAVCGAETGGRWEVGGGKRSVIGAARAIKPGELSGVRPSATLCDMYVSR